MVRHNVVILGLNLVVACVGCTSRSGPALAPVEGTVTMDGKPLPNAVVSFVPTNQTLGQGGRGKTDATGKFEILTQDQQQKGLPAGTYRVAISKFVNPDGTDFVGGADADPMSSAFKELIPPAYSDMAASRLSETIPEAGAKTLEFKLDSKSR